jgi:hypothetical protein
MPTQAILFDEEQAMNRGWPGLMIAIIVLVAGFLAGIAAWDPAAADGIARASILVFGILGAVTLLLLVARLTVRVDSGHIHVRFFPLLFRRDIPLADVARWEARAYQPILEYGGWGLRTWWGSHNSAYNMKGNRGVQLVFTNGDRLLIGSQRAADLAAAISAAKRPAA